MAVKPIWRAKKKSRKLATGSEAHSKMASRISSNINDQEIFTETLSDNVDNVDMIRRPKDVEAVAEEPEDAEVVDAGRIKKFYFVGFTGTQRSSCESSFSILNRSS